MQIEVRLFDELIETFDLGDVREVERFVRYVDYHSRNRRYRIEGHSVVEVEGHPVPEPVRKLRV